MSERHLSMRGEVVDFNRLRLNNAQKPALGNANMNARGDIISEEGIVIKTQEQIEAEWALKTTETQTVMSGINIKDMANVHANTAPTANKQLQNPPGLEPKVVDPTDSGFEPVFEQEPAQNTKTRRKIVESD